MQGMDIPSWLNGALYAFQACKAPSSSSITYILSVAAIFIALFSFCYTIFKNHFYKRHSVSFIIGSSIASGNQEPKNNIISIVYPSTSPPTLYEMTAVVFVNDGTEAEVINGLQIVVEGGGTSMLTQPYVLAPNDSITYLIPMAHSTIRAAAGHSPKTEAYFYLEIFYFDKNRQQQKKSVRYGQVSLSPDQMEATGGFSGLQLIEAVQIRKLY